MEEEDNASVGSHTGGWGEEYESGYGETESGYVEPESGYGGHESGYDSSSSVEGGGGISESDE